MAGFIKTNVEIKILTLYILDSVSMPISFDQLAEVAICDEGVDYFLLKQVVTELVEMENITQLDGTLAITPRGRQNNKSCYQELAYTIRSRCDKSVKELNRQLHIDQFVQGEVVSCEDNSKVVKLSFSDQTGMIMELNLMHPHGREGQKIVSAFKRDPANFYQTIMEQVQKLANEAPET